MKIVYQIRKSPQKHLFIMFYYLNAYFSDSSGIFDAHCILTILTVC